MLDFMLICNDPDKARAAIAAGVNRIFIDLESLGKQERQHGRDTVISAHAMEDVTAIRRALPGSEILVRTNPIHDGIEREVDDVIGRGADVVMLPMFRGGEEVARFVECVGGRARICLLVETPQALVRLPHILEMSEQLAEVYVGLNDLHLGLGLSFMFECLAGGLVDHAAAMVRAKGLRFGFGGLGRLGSGAVAAELVLSEHVRVGSSLVILSRTFLSGLTTSMERRIAELRTEERRLRTLPAEALERNRAELCRQVWSVAGKALPQGHQ